MTETEKAFFGRKKPAYTTPTLSKEQQDKINVFTTCRGVSAEQAQKYLYQNNWALPNDCMREYNRLSKSVWFEILKDSWRGPNVEGDVTEDIDFDNSLRAMGQYSQESKNIGGEEIVEMMFALEGKLRMSDMIKEKIRISPREVKETLEERLERRPTDKELLQYIVRVIMHEATHAGMSFEQHGMTTAQAEYGAFTGQFPENTYLRIKAYLKHPASNVNIIPKYIVDMLGITEMFSLRSAEKFKDIISTIDGITGPLPNGQRKEEIKEQFARFEIVAINQNKPEIGEDLINDTKDYDVLMEAVEERWGSEAVPLLDEIYDALKTQLNTGDEEKMAGAVSVSNSPSMFGERYSNEEEDEDYA